MDAMFTPLRQKCFRPGLATLLGFGMLAMLQPGASASNDDNGADPLPALERDAHPVRTTEPGGDAADLRPFGRMIGDADIVSLGEPTHGSHEFVTMHQRIFNYLVEEKGFRTFSREISWSTGLLLNEYIQNGTGNPREIMDRELETFYQVFDNREFLDFIESLRVYNARHEQNVQIIGSDATYAGPVVFEKVDDYLAEHYPAMRSSFNALYAGLKPEPGTHLAEYMAAFGNKSPTERKMLAVKAKTALRLLQAMKPGGDSPHRRNYVRTLQHARAIAQTAKGYSFDTTTGSGLAAWGAWRDQTMADNIEWWHEHTGDKTIVSNMNAHASYEPIDSETAPRTVGRNLREKFGDEHVNVGFSFAKGHFNAKGPDGAYDDFGVEAEAGQNEFTLDRVRYDDYMLDMRNVPQAARRWLSKPRPTFNIGGDFDPEDTKFEVALAVSYDVLFHLDEVRAADPLYD